MIPNYIAIGLAEHNLSLCLERSSANRIHIKKKDKDSKGNLNTSMKFYKYYCCKLDIKRNCYTRIVEAYHDNYFQIHIRVTESLLTGLVS